MSISVSLVGANKILRQGMATLLQEQGIAVAASAQSVEGLDGGDTSLIVMHGNSASDVAEAALVMDGRLPTPRIIAIINSANSEDVIAGLEAGAAECLIDSISAESFAAAIRLVTVDAALIEEAGKLTGSSKDLPFYAKVHGLTRRQTQILELMTRGETNKAIGEALGIEASTVKQHINKILAKMHVMNRTQVAAIVAGKEPQSARPAAAPEPTAH